jgi:hypothetical protein
MKRFERDFKGKLFQKFSLNRKSATTGLSSYTGGRGGPPLRIAKPFGRGNPAPTRPGSRRVGFSFHDVVFYVNKLSLKTLFQYLFTDMRRRQKRSSAFGASMKRFERDFKGKLFQKFSLNPIK